MTGNRPVMPGKGKHLSGHAPSVHSEGYIFCPSEQFVD
jgi:hypothetical protein